MAALWQNKKTMRETKFHDRIFAGGNNKVVQKAHNGV